MSRRGNCYTATEALYHILGGRAAGWKAMRLPMRTPDYPEAKETHWYLQHDSGVIVDASRLQFNFKGWWPRPDYSRGRGSGFLTKRPSRAALELMKRLTWHTPAASRAPSTR